MADESVRLQLEIAIEKIGSTVDITKTDLSWLEDPEWYAFQDACCDLVDYYAQHGDTVIGPLALGEYADFTRLLRKTLLFQEIDKQRSNQAEEASIFLEGWMDEIRKETMTNLRYQHPELDL
ncbi:MAG: hypothetical protein H7Y09_01790 [Chitinophagaceae bacterium]|nr:hypothetical protein [Anaerolineae bacterium]